MEQTRFPDSLIISYLLGQPFPVEEKSRLEEAIFNEDETFEHMCAVESALIDDYVRGDLSPEEHTRFEKYYLCSSERLERVYLAQALMKAASEFKPKEEPILPPITSAESSWRQKLLALLNGPLLIPKGAYAILGALLMLVIGGWFVIENVRVRERLARSQTELQRGEEESKRDIVELRAKLDTTAQERDRERGLRQAVEIENAKLAHSTPKVIVPFILSGDSSDTRKGVNDPNPPPSTQQLKLYIPSDATEIHLRLDLNNLDLSEKKYTKYEAKLKSVMGGEKEIWSKNQARAKKTPSGATVSLTIPARHLKPGRYHLYLSGLDPDGQSIPVQIFSFIVVKP